MPDNEKYVVTIGGLCIDEYYHKEYWPQEGNKAVIKKDANMAGGMIPNAAAVFAGYGEKTYFYDVMNSGPVTQYLENELQGYGIDTSLIEYDENLPDAKCIIVRAGKERTILVVDSQKDRFSLNRKQLDIFRGAEYIYTTISEMKKFENYMDLVKDLKSHGAQIVFDVETSTYKKEDAVLLEMADVLFFNEFGFEAYREERNEEECYQHLFQCGVKVVTVTLGEDGSYTRTPTQENKTKALRFDVVDTTGAGDTFNSSFVRCLMNQMSIQESARFANAAAGRSVTVMGPKGGVCSAEEIEKLVNENYDKF